MVSFGLQPLISIELEVNLDKASRLADLQDPTMPSLSKDIKYPAILQSLSLFQPGIPSSVMELDENDILNRFDQLVKNGVIFYSDDYRTVASSHKNVSVGSLQKSPR